MHLIRIMPPYLNQLVEMMDTPFPTVVEMMDSPPPTFGNLRTTASYPTLLVRAYMESFTELVDVAVNMIIQSIAQKS